jgi:hypothetical protein|tara:strand:+ start:1532 stop:1822 length:291 start_codon:yes stop_codon:yes gene_type:complete
LAKTNKIIGYFKESYEQDRLCFWLEMIGTFVNIIASLTLALNAADPDMRYVYPFFLVGSALAIFTFHRRKLVWPTMLVSYFFCANALGFGIAMRWW